MSPDLILLAVSLFIWGIGEGMFFYFQPLYLQQLGADSLQIGIILGIAGIAMTAAHIPAGYLADRIGRRSMLWAAWLFGSFAAWLMALATSMPVFVTGLLMYGLTAFVSAPLNSYVTAARGKLPVGRALSLISGTFNLGMVAGPISGGWLADHFNLRTIYFTAAVIFVFSTVIVFLLHSQLRDQYHPDSPPLRLILNRRYLSFLVISFIVFFSMYLPQPLTPNFLQNERGLSFSEIGILGTIGALGNSFLSLGLGLLNARLGFMISQLAVGLFSLLIWSGEGTWVFGLAFFLLGGFRAARPLAVAQVRSLVHQSQMGLAYGFTETVNSLPAILAPPLAGYLYALNPILVYPLSMVMIAGVMTVTAFLAPKFQPEISTSESH